MKKVIIIGSKGMAGHVLYHYLKESGEFQVVDVSRSPEYFPSRYNLDITNFEELGEILKKESPSYIINCVGLLNRNADENPDMAVLVNGYMPHFLAKQATSIGARLIHISTDCVFSGKRGNYREDDPKDGKGFYAESKAIGEVVYGGHVTLRTSIIGPELKQNGIGLFNWFMKQEGTVKGYTGAVWTGITTIELARAIVKVMKSEITGLHHIVNGSKINKYELLMLFKKCFERNTVTIVPNDIYLVDKSLLQGEIVFTSKTYELMVKEMKEWILSHQSIYPPSYH